MKELLELIAMWDSMDVEADAFYQAWGDRVGNIRLMVQALQAQGCVAK